MIDNMIDNITKILKPFQQFLFSKFRQDNPRVRVGIEMLLMMIFGDKNKAHNFNIMGLCIILVKA